MAGMDHDGVTLACAVVVLLEPMNGTRQLIEVLFRDEIGRRAVLAFDDEEPESANAP